MLNLETNYLVFMFNGAEKKVRIPTARQWGVYQSGLSQLKEPDEIINACCDFLALLGLDRETADILESTHMHLIMDELSGSKKK